MAADGGAASSPALSMNTDQLYPPDGRVVQLLASDGADLKALATLQQGLLERFVAPHVVAPHKGTLTGTGRRAPTMTVDRSFLTACSAEADAFVVGHGTTLAGEAAVLTYLQEAYRHHKPIIAIGDGADVLAAAGIPADSPGVVVAEKADKALVRVLVDSLGRHRTWDRPTPANPRKAIR
jgi:catalase